MIVNSHPQEAVLRTSILEGFDPIEIRWRAERYDPTTYTWEEVWTHESDESLQGAGAYWIDFGAPGLTEGGTYAFRVAWRNSQGWLCYSNRSSSITPTSFSNLPPASPAGTSFVVEDSFERPVTTFKCDTNNPQGGVGDGLGPQGVWQDCQIGRAGTGPTIGDQGHSARFPPSSVAPYMARHATHRHNFTEAQARVAEGVGVGIKYNYQVTAREHLAGAPLEQRGYAAKLVYGVRDCHTKPSLTIFRLQDEYAGAGCSPEQGNPPLLPWGILIPDANNPTGKCTAMPPLDQVDSTTGTSYPVWLRIEVTDVGSPAVPQITATVAWGNCPADQGIDSCEFACRATRTDTNLDMAYPTGGREDRWGVSFHDKTYFVDLFRTGSEE